MPETLDHLLILQRAHTSVKCHVTIDDRRSTTPLSPAGHEAVGRHSQEWTPSRVTLAELDCARRSPTELQSTTEQERLRARSLSDIDLFTAVNDP